MKNLQVRTKFYWFWAGELVLIVRTDDILMIIRLCYLYINT